MDAVFIALSATIFVFGAGSVFVLHDVLARQGS